MTLDDDAELSAPEVLREMLDALVGAFALEAEVAVEEVDGVLTGAVNGNDVQALVGEGGSVLDAIQHLAQRIVLRGGEGLRVVVDAGGYRERREAELRVEADVAAAAAVAEGKEIALSPMPAAERRFVHEHLRERGDVETHSEGEEPRRCLVVAPRDLPG
ncbi:MAG TPA: R3H domain-containing nucleic acid-binding protein [Solirubrobacteraceae bacterium]|nr:R3H domain-containing nucleic acid-binding protein [Solirubrobacteraceae bacterium]